jgi:hypothetical protein
MTPPLPEVGVFGVECVTALAMRSCSVSPRYIFPTCDRLKVGRIYAAPVSAKMIKRHPVRDRANKMCVCRTVGE